MTLAPTENPADSVETAALIHSPSRDWEGLIAQFVHPVKVAVVEALLSIGEPLSAAQLAKLFSGAGGGFREPTVRYHVCHLVKAGILEIVPYGPFGDPSGKEKFVYFAGRVSYMSDSEQSC